MKRELRWELWEIDAMIDVHLRWNINMTEAENFLVNVGLLE